MLQWFHTSLPELSKSFTGAVAAVRHQLSTSHVPYHKAQCSVRVCLSVYCGLGGCGLGLGLGLGLVALALALGVVALLTSLL